MSSREQFLRYIAIVLLYIDYYKGENQQINDMLHIPYLQHVNTKVYFEI